MSGIAYKIEISSTERNVDGLSHIQALNECILFVYQVSNGYVVLALGKQR